MKYQTGSCGYTINFPGPDTIEEYDEKSGEVGTALKDAVSNTIYRSTLPEWQAAFAKLLVERTGIPREIDAEATARVKSKSKNPDNTRDVPERFRTYNTRVVTEWAGGAKNGDKEKLTQLATWAQEVADNISVDPAPARISAIAKGDLLKAEDILEGDLESIETKVQKYLAAVPDFELLRDEDNRPEKQSLARLVGKYIDVVL